MVIIRDSKLLAVPSCGYVILRITVLSGVDRKFMVDNSVIIM